LPATGLLRKRLVRYVAQKLSRVPATDGKETSYRDGSLFVREVRLEGLGALIRYSVIEGGPLGVRTPGLVAP